jgi:NADPH:quinone reductase-like Zn-dependent oxidoreductase
VKAAYLTGHGGNEVVAVGERPMPDRKRGDVLVRMKAATVNRVDLYMRDSGAGITHTPCRRSWAWTVLVSSRRPTRAR